MSEPILGGVSKRRLSWLLTPLSVTIFMVHMQCWTALHLAARYGHAEICDLLVAASADTKERNSGGLGGARCFSEGVGGHVALGAPHAAWAQYQLRPDTAAPRSLCQQRRGTAAAACGQSECGFEDSERSGPLEEAEAELEKHGGKCLSK
eukprot:Skav215737  [mRNA]  locus=scaffold2859:124296:124822:+ [translate_table: standard]